MSNETQTKTEIKSIPYSQKEWLKICKENNLNTVSSQIRFLSQEYSTPENKYGLISRFLNKRIQHVREVLTRPLKKG